MIYLRSLFHHFCSARFTYKIMKHGCSNFFNKLVTYKQYIIHVNCFFVGRLTGSNISREMSTTCLLLLFWRRGPVTFTFRRCRVPLFVSHFNKRTTQLEMLGQAKIHSFFTTDASKRGQDDNRIADAQQVIMRHVTCQVIPRP